MYPGKFAKENPDRPAFIMASTGETVTYKEYEARTNRLAHLLARKGLRPRVINALLFRHNRTAERHSPPYAGQFTS